MDNRSALHDCAAMKLSVRSFWLGFFVVGVAFSALAAHVFMGKAHSTAVILATFEKNQGIWDNRFDQQMAKANDLLAGLGAETDPAKRIETQRQIAEHYLLGGQVNGAIDLLKQLLVKYQSTASHPQIEKIKSTLALAYLRYGELQNCTWNHSADSCLFPLKAGGIHQQRFGVQQAIDLLQELLTDAETSVDNALGYRWLLNVAYMAAGRYPDSVPKQWLIASTAFDSPHEFARFEDVATQKGVGAFGLAGGALMEDFDNDGHLDLMTSSWGNRDPLRYFHNRKSGPFEDLSASAIPAGINGGLQIVGGDYNRDGFADVLVLRGGWLHAEGRQPMTLLRNNGNNSFTDVTFDAGITAQYPTQTAAWADYDNDGQLDLIVGNEISPQVEWPSDTPNFELYHNEGNGRFVEVGARSGLHIKGWVKGLSWGDFDNDGRQDLYVSVMGGDNQLFRNLGARPDALPQFEDVTRKAGVAAPRMSFACWFWDFDNDGWLDIFVAGYSSDLAAITRAALGEQDPRAELPRLYHNNHDGTFSDVTKVQGLDLPLMVMGSNYGDLDNDGWLDLYLGTGAPGLDLLVPNRMFHNHEGKTFDDVTTAGGFGHLQKGHGVAWGDIDNDGDQDIYEVIGGAFEADGFWNALFENPGHPGNHWITLRLKGVQSNRFGIGSRIHIRVVEPDGSHRDIHHLVGSGGSFGGNSMQAELGLGAAAAIESIDIEWAGSGLHQSYPAPSFDQIYRVAEGSPSLLRQ